MLWLLNLRLPKFTFMTILNILIFLAVQYHVQILNSLGIQLKAMECAGTNLKLVFFCQAPKTVKYYYGISIRQFKQNIPYDLCYNSIIMKLMELFMMYVGQNIIVIFLEAVEKVEYWPYGISEAKAANQANLKLKK